MIKALNSFSFSCIKLKHFLKGEITVNMKNYQNSHLGYFCVQYLLFNLACNHLLTLQIFLIGCTQKNSM